MRIWITDLGSRKFFFIFFFRLWLVVHGVAVCRQFLPLLASICRPLLSRLLYSRRSPARYQSCETVSLNSPPNQVYSLLYRYFKLAFFNFMSSFTNSGGKSRETFHIDYPSSCSDYFIDKESLYSPLKIIM